MEFTLVLANAGAICYKSSFRLVATMKKPSKRALSPAKAEKGVRTAATVQEPAEAREPAPPLPVGPSQAEAFAQASRLFHAGQYAEARRLFEEAAGGANREMAHSARLHVRMCEQRLSREAPALATAEDHYNYAVALVNRRDFQSARQHLEQALQMADDGDHIHYALALCLGYLGDIDGACHHLRRAIELHPRNRAAARSDPDFAELIHKPQISELLVAGKGVAG